MRQQSYGTCYRKAVHACFQPEIGSPNTDNIGLKRSRKLSGVIEWPTEKVLVPVATAFRTAESAPSQSRRYNNRQPVETGPCDQHSSSSGTCPKAFLICFHNELKAFARPGVYSLQNGLVDPTLSSCQKFSICQGIPSLESYPWFL